MKRMEIKEKTMASITDVAKQADVCPATVSRVINGRLDVSPDIVRAVEEAMQSLNYTPRAVRPGPKTADRRGIRTGTVMFLSLASSSPERLYRIPALPSMLEGIETGLKNHGLDLILAHSTDGKTVPQVLARNQVDGLVLFGHSQHGKPSEALRRILEKTPAVWCFRGPADPQQQFDHVFYDNSHVGELAANHLITSGCRTLVFLNPWEQMVFEQRREQFFRSANQAGIECNDIRPTEWPKKEHRARAVANLTEQLISGSISSTGVFCPADDIMLTVFNTLHKFGIEPGRDIELIGCNNDPQFTGQMHPRPATIDIGLREVGEKAVARLLRRMSYPGEEREEILIKPELIPAETEEQRTEVGDQRNEVRKVAQASSL